MKSISWLFAFFAAAANAYGVTTMQMGETTGYLTNLQNSSGAFNQPLVWGVLVDTTGNGFLGGTYSSGFTVSDTASISNGQLLSDSLGLTDDRLFISTNLMATGGSGDGSTGMAKPTNIILSYSVDTPSATGVNALGGQAIAIVWFDYTTKTGQTTASGHKYGLYVLPFTSPADALGGSVAYGATYFSGADPVRSASLSLIPEPSTFFLTSMGVLALLRRRR